ncbi:hypothetical protein [Prosthecobacter sp.]|jgi:hypothetical protein|uniref:hypothetical protein n=1 Tax=Prosthecobacter sp. TaxID=1965333 RepID=UPI00378409D7
MPVLPSGLRYTFSVQPFWDLVGRVSDELKQDDIWRFTPEFLLIREPDDLRRYIGILWVVPEAADLRTSPHFAGHQKRLPPGWCVLDSGTTFDCLPAHLDAKDRHSLSGLWKYLRVRPTVTKLLNVVHKHHKRMADSSSEDFRRIASWFPRSQPQGERQPALVENDEI